MPSVGTGGLEARWLDVPSTTARRIYMTACFGGGTEASAPEYCAVMSSNGTHGRYRLTGGTKSALWDQRDAFNNAGTYRNGSTVADSQMLPMPATLWRFDSSAPRTQECRLLRGNSPEYSRWNGALGEVIFTDGKEGRTTQQRIEGYLAWRWGLAEKLPPDHPYRSRRPSIGYVPLPEPYFEWDAALDTDGDDKWPSTTANAYAWQFDAGAQTPVDVESRRLLRISKAYVFPGARDESSASFDGHGSIQPASFEFVIDVDADDGVIFESGGSLDGIRFDMSEGNLRGTIAEGKDVCVEYTLTEDEKADFVHAVFVVDNAANVMQIYVDGRLKASAVWATGDDWSGSDAAGMGGTGGGTPDDKDTGDFTGKMALFRYYRNHALDEEAIGALYDRLKSERAPKEEPAAADEGAASPPPDARTPTVPFDAVEFGGHFYKVYPERMTWHDAKRFCEELGGHLVTITSAQEQSFVADLARRSAIPGSTWIGLTEEGHLGDWRWVTDEPLAYRNWAKGEPNSREGKEHWGSIKQPQDFGWNDEIAGSNWNGGALFCEWDAGAIRQSAPDSLEGLLLWLDACDVDGDGKPDAIAEGTRVAKWADKSGGGNDATEPSVKNQPTYGKFGGGKRPAVSFDAVDDGMATALDLSAPYTVCAVFSCNSLWVNRRAVQGSRNWLIGPRGGKLHHFAGNWVSNNTLCLSGEMYVTVATNTGSESRFYVDGIDVTAGKGVASPGRIGLGVRGAYPEPLAGDIAEVIIYKRALSSAERIGVCNYLRRKWPGGRAAGKPDGCGLIGTYFKGKNFEAPVLRRLDAQVDFNWGGTAPASGVPREGFSVRWEGFIYPPKTGKYIFVIASDDGMRLVVANRKIADVWRGGVHNDIRSQPVSMREDAACNIRLDFYQASGPSKIRLLWTGPGIPEPVPVPSECLRPPPNY